MDSTHTIKHGFKGDLETLIIENQFAYLEIALFGAHILSFVPKTDHRERLWLSPHADFTGSKPIRGGIPICWPWFGSDTPDNEKNLPSHGTVRNQQWRLTENVEHEKGTQVTLQPENTRTAQLQHSLSVSLTVDIGSRLKVMLTTTNHGRESVKFNAALHSYFYVDKVINASITGIGGDYKDKLENWAIKPTPAPYHISAETDRIHLCTAKNTQIKNGNDTTDIHHLGHDSIVVWNPWTGAASMPDMDAFGYKNMLCIETALTQWYTLGGSQTHVLGQTIG
jgi:glucose-6-phosphate 1-epimerase